jgi:hypothetical protein
MVAELCFIWHIAYLFLCFGHKPMYVIYFCAGEGSDVGMDLETDGTTAKESEMNQERHEEQEYDYDGLEAEGPEGELSV